MRINSISGRNYLTVENLAALERKDLKTTQQKSIIPKRNKCSFTYLVEVHCAHLQVRKNLKETMQKN